MLEGRHVIGLFMLMLLFSGVFFTLGYVMGRNQNDGQVSASTSLRGPLSPDVQPKSEAAAKSGNKKPAMETQPETTTPAAGDWEFYHAGDSNKADDRLKTAVNSTPALGVAKRGGASKPGNAASKGSVGTSATAGLNLQVSATTREADAMALANTLRKKNFPTFVQPPQSDRFYHVLVGPYADQKALDNARKGLEAAGFKKAIVKR